MPGVRVRVLEDEITDAHGGIDIAVDALTDIGRMSPSLNPFTSELITELEKIKGRLREWKYPLEMRRSQ